MILIKEFYKDRHGNSLSIWMCIIFFNLNQDQVL